MNESESKRLVSWTTATGSVLWLHDDGAWRREDGCVWDRCTLQSRAVAAEIVRLRRQLAEHDRLRSIEHNDRVNADVDANRLRWELKESRRHSEDADRMIATLRQQLGEAEKLVADMHAAAVGCVCGPIRGVVEDVADLRSLGMKLQRQLICEQNRLKIEYDAVRGLEGEVNDLRQQLDERDRRISELELQLAATDADGSMIREILANTYEFVYADAPAGQVECVTFGPGEAPRTPTKAEPFKITGPGRYRQRDGGVATVEGALHGPTYVWCGKGSDRCRATWTDTGAYNVNRCDNRDLVARID